jgi:hypothetical protein
VAGKFSPPFSQQNEVGGALSGWRDARLESSSCTVTYQYGALARSPLRFLYTNGDIGCRSVHVRLARPFFDSRILRLRRFSSSSLPCRYSTQYCTAEDLC